MPPIKAVLFDLDDTLWPIVPVIMRAESLLFDWMSRHAPGVTRRYTIDSLREERKKLMVAHPAFALDLQALRHAALRDAFDSVGEDSAKVDQAMAVFVQARNEVILYNDVLPGLKQLKNLFALGTISNGTTDLAAVGLTQYFQVSLSAREFGCAKPDPEIFLAACDAMGVRPQEAAYVGDDPLLDVEGAQKAGLHGIWINRSGVETHAVFPDHVHPDVICTTLFELEQSLTGRIMRTSA